MNLRDRILAADDLPTKDLEVPEWGGVTVRLKAASPGMLFDMQQVFSGNGTADTAEQSRRICEVLATRLLDPETNQPIFPPETAADDLLQKNPAILKRFADELRDMQPDPIETAKENLEPTPEPEPTAK